jgi:hypothetical protein
MVLMSLSYLLNTRCQCLTAESQIAASQISVIFQITQLKSSVFWEIALCSSIAQCGLHGIIFQNIELFITTTFENLQSDISTIVCSVVASCYNLCWLCHRDAKY